MTLYTQSEYSGECGNISLHNALVLQRVPVTLKAVRKATGKGDIAAAINGIDDYILIKAAKAFDVNVEIYDGVTYLGMMRQLNRYISSGYTCIISTRDAEHWAVIHAKSTHGYMTLDSSRDDVIKYLSPSQTKRWINACGTFYFIAIRKK